MQRAQYSLRLFVIGSIFALFSSASFAIVLHDAVQATANLNTRSTPSASGTLIATMPSGSTGTTDNGSIVADGYTWWYVRWGTGQQGWSIQDYLATVSPSLLAYSDKLEYGWYLYPWANTSANTLSSTHQYGTNGIQVTTYASWARLYLKTNGFNTGTYGSQTLRFSINGGSLAGQNLYVALYDTGGAPMQYVNIAAYVNGGNLSSAQWYDVAIPLTDINAGNRIVGGFVIEAAQAMTFYVDDIWFPSSLSSTKWTPTAPTITGVNVNCSPNLIEIYQASQCNAIVNGTGSYNSAVTWSTNTGSINSSGFFTAPSYTTTATVIATSVQDVSKSGTAYVTVTTPPPPQASQSGSIVYSETIGWGWDVGMWPNVIVNTTSPNAYRGDNGIEMQTTAQWGRAQLIASSNFKFNTTGYESLSFAINIGANEGEDLYVGLLNASSGILQYQNIRNYAENGTLNSYQWKHVRIPLSALSGSNTDVYGVEIQSTNPATLYFDEVQFELNGTNGGCQ